MSATLTQQLEERVRRELSSLDNAQARELASIIEQLVAAFPPERVYAFGSRARGDAERDSDVDLMVVITESDEQSYRRARTAYQTIDRRVRFGLDLVVFARNDFDDQAANPATLPGRVVREGRLLFTRHLPTYVRHAEPLIARARMNLRAAGVMLDADLPLTDGAVFHAHEAAAQGLRGFLTAFGMPIPRTQAIEELLLECAVIDDAFSDRFPAGATLSPYATQLIYPFKTEHPSTTAAHEAIVLARDIVEFVGQRLNSRPITPDPLHACGA